MRILLLITSLFLLTHCTVAEESANGNGGTGGGGNTTKEIQFKTITGGYETLSTDQITLLKIGVSDSTGGTTVLKTYTLPESSNRAKDLGLHQPGQKNLSKLQRTGSVAISFVVKGSTDVVTRNFEIFEHQYLKDAVFADVVYTTNKKITFDWLEN